MLVFYFWFTVLSFFEASGFYYIHASLQVVNVKYYQISGVKIYQIGIVGFKSDNKENT